MQIAWTDPHPTVVFLYLGDRANDKLASKLRHELVRVPGSRVVCLDYRMADFGPPVAIASIGTYEKFIISKAQTIASSHRSFVGGVEISPGVVSERHRLWRYEAPYRDRKDEEYEAMLASQPDLGEKLLSGSSIPPTATHWCAVYIASRPAWFHDSYSVRTHPVSQ